MKRGMDEILGAINSKDADRGKGPANDAAAKSARKQEVKTQKAPAKD
jgi:hypothetical protein